MDQKQKTDLLNSINPIKFADGKDVFSKYMDEYIVHKKGLFILAPSGSGKTFFVNHQEKKDWIDGDKLWCDTKAQPDEEKWWTMGVAKINEVDQKSDVITMYAKKLGLWIIGSSVYNIVPDAVIIPDWEKHQEYIKQREQNNYDGGATSNDLGQVIGSRKFMEDIALRGNAPIFQSIEEAVEALTKSIE